MGRRLADFVTIATSYPLLLPLLAVAFLGPASGAVAAVVALVDPSILLELDSSSTRCCGALIVGAALFVLAAADRRPWSPPVRPSLESRLSAVVCLQLAAAWAELPVPEGRQTALASTR